MSIISPKKDSAREFIRRLGSALGLSLLVVVVPPALARGIDPAERREVPFDASLPSCQDPRVVSEIAANFAVREDRFLELGAAHRPVRAAWSGELAHVGLDYIPRRFCTGRVLTNDGRLRRIHYSIREDLGIIGLSWGTDWCVLGLDRHNAHAPACRQALP
jgi:hypothetical protein